MTKEEAKTAQKTIDEIDKWVGRLRIKSSFYIRKIEEYPYLGVVCYPSGEKKFIICNTKNKKICDIGLFTEEGGFEEAFKNFKDGPFYEFNKDFIEKSIETYGFPIKDRGITLPEEEIVDVADEEADIADEKESDTSDKNDEKLAKLTYNEINSWINDLPVNSKPYAKIMQNFPYALISVRSKQQYGLKTLWFINPITKKRLFWVGDFQRDNAEFLFKRIPIFLKEAKLSRNERAQAESTLKLFGLPQHQYDMQINNFQNNDNGLPLLTIDKEIEKAKKEAKSKKKDVPEKPKQDSSEASSDVIKLSEMKMPWLFNILSKILKKDQLS